MTFLRGRSQDISVKDSRFVVLSAQVAHTMGNYGFLWIDTKSPENRMIFAANYNVDNTNSASAFIVSEAADAKNLPPEFLSAWKKWMDKLHLCCGSGSIEIFGPNGTHRIVPANTL
ncbi:MAG: hypothetical protein JSS87_09835 [Acidobacteria bacterium]|nr:hypothetical protein [Acidobacteriota bacterium]